MKKVLLLGGVGYDKDALEALGNAHNLTFDFVGIQQIVCDMTDQGITWSLRNRKDLQYDAVFVRGVQSLKAHRDSLVQRGLVSGFCKFMKKQGAVIIDPGIMHTDSLNKVEMTQRLLEAGMPIVPSRFILSINGVKKSDLPCIVKATIGSCGVGVYKLTTVEDLRAWRKEATFPTIVQRWIPNNSDVRALVVGGKIATAVERKRMSGDLNNLSQGAEGAEIQLSPELQDLAIRAAKAFEYDIAGVDLLYDQENDAWYMLEINRAPDWEYTPKIATGDVMGQIMQLIADRINAN